MNYLSGGIKDGTTPCKLSWLVTEKAALGLSADCGRELYQTLLLPPNCFFLSIITSPEDNLLQCAIGNDLVKGETATTQTPYQFTINNVTFGYTVYELEQAAANQTQGHQAGVRELLKLYGPVPKDLVKHVATVTPQEEKRGRPKLSVTDPRSADVVRPLSGKRR